MAGTMVHLLTAERLWEKIHTQHLRYGFDVHIEPLEDYFIAGNICPDGIMARKPYERSMKLHTHFRDGIPDGSFHKPGMLPVFRQRMKEFWEIHTEDERYVPGLYLGYITHMMTDEKFILEERPKFFEAIRQIGLTQEDRETFVYFNRETDLVDFRLCKEQPLLKKAESSLRKVPPYEIKGMITQEELTNSRNWILHHFFQEEHTLQMPLYLSYERMLQFTENAAVIILERLQQKQILV